MDVRLLLRKALRDRSVRDVFYLSLVQAATLLVPLITFPWVVRALKPESYGIYSFGLAITQYLLLFVDFGFQYAGSRRVVELRDDQLSLDRYFWTVQYAKFALCIASTLLILLLGFVIPQVGTVLWVIIASLPLLLASVFQSTWFFMGLGRLATPSLLNVGFRIGFVLPIFLFVRHPGDEWLLALLNSASALLGGIASALLIIRSGLIRSIPRVSLAQISAAYRDAWHLFIAQGAVSLYAASNSVILGFVSSPVQVAFFAASDRLRSIAVMPIVPVTNAYFSRISHELKASPELGTPLLKGVAIFLFCGMMLMSAFIFLAADWIVATVLGPSFSSSAAVLRMMSPIPATVALTTVFGNLVMVNMGFNRALSSILISCGAANIIGLIFLGHLFGAVGAAASLCLTEFLVTFLFWLYLRRRGISVFRRTSKAAPSSG